MTYYDIRPPDASVLSKRGQLENSNPLNDHKNASKSIGAGEAKHFGPREIRRRPLPPDPTGQTPPRPPMPEIHSSPIYCSQGYGSPDGDQGQWAADRDFHAPSELSAREDAQDEGKPFDFELPRERVHPISARSDCYSNTRGGSKSFDDYQTPPKARACEFSDSVDYGSYNLPSDDIQYGNQGHEERRHSAQPAFPSHGRQNPTASSPYGSSSPPQGLFRPAPSSSDIRQRAQFNRFSTSPIKNDVFKDSPLKQSMSHTEFPRTHDKPQELNEDDAPPPPPAHRSSADRGLPSSISYQDLQVASIPEPLNVSSAPVRTLPNLRSPLQSIERSCDPLLQNQASMPSPSSDRSGGYVAYSKPVYTPDAMRNRTRSDTSPSYLSYMPQSLRSGYQPTVIDANSQSDAAEDQAQDRNSANPLQPSYAASSVSEKQPVRREGEIYGLEQPNFHHTSDYTSFVYDRAPISQDRDNDRDNDRGNEVYGMSRPDSKFCRDREVYGDRYFQNATTPPGYADNRRPQSGQGTSPYGRQYQRSPADRQYSSDANQGVRTEAPISKPGIIGTDDRSFYKVPARKSVSPSSGIESIPPPERRLSGMPFSPDSYDILNPSSTNNSSATAPSHPRYETPEQAAEATRQREVEKMREVGPIIGNDGRVIDPSDHLPTDTWAPEPERKPKKPEVVIRFKTGNNTTPRTPPNISPGPSSRPHSMYGSSPGSMDTPSYGNVRSGRNRLQKPNPTRPLPTQPYATSSPAPPISSSSPYHTPSPRNPARNSFSEYPLRENQNFGNATYNSGGSRGAAPGWAPPRPAKVPLSAEDVGMDALAREMQSIDIGVGRGPRTRRGY